MVIVEVPPLFEFMIRLVPDSCLVQLATGKMPFPEMTDPNVTITISKGRRPPKPRRFEAPGMTSKVWKVAKTCWHEKAKERPEVNDVLHNLERIANAGVCTHKACLCSPWELIDDT